MQDTRIVNSRKQKSQRAMIPQIPENIYTRGPQEVSPPLLPMKTTLKASKKNSKKNGVPPFYRQQQERPKPSAQQMESSGVYNEYRALRRKFLLLEEESCNLGNELGEVEDEIKNLEDAKGELLDQLVVLEGLVDPSELQKQ